MCKAAYTALASILLLVTSTLVHAEIFRWVDESGRVHFTDSPPSDKQVEEVTLKINSYTAVEVIPLLERLGKDGKVVIYTATWCGYCAKAKKYFRQNKIPYVAYDVEKNRIGKNDFKLLKGKSVPIIIIGNRRMNGFNVARFDMLYQQYLHAINSVIN